jgi:hypothetical protein
MSVNKGANPPKLRSTEPCAESPIECLLEGLIDYAGLFPPASLSMSAAVANYAEYSRSNYEWMLGRFIVPAARLVEFEKALDALPLTDSDSLHWKVSALLGSDPGSDMNHIQRFTSRRATRDTGTKVDIESVETRASSPEEVLRLDALIPREITAYIELPLAGHLHELVAAVAECSRRRLKIRTGGEIADKIPSPDTVIEFLCRCLSAGLPFKATAGLHHPMRSVHRLTYDPDSPSAMMHGFLNVFLAAAFLRGGMDGALAGDVLREESPAAFRFDAIGVSWHEHQLSARDLLLARRDFAISFGSCSFMEPIEDLQALRLL